MESSLRCDLQELLQFVAYRLGAEAVGLVVLMPDGEGQGANLVVHESEDPSPQVLHDLAEALEHCAQRARRTARKYELTFS